MLGIEARAFRIAWTLFLLILVIAIIYEIRQTILVFAGAIFFSYILWPLVSFVQRFTTRRRGLALAIVYVLLIGAMIGIGFAVIPAILAQATNLFTRLPSLITGAQISKIPLPQFLDPVRDQLISAVRAQAASIGPKVIGIIQEIGSHLLSGFAIVATVVLIPIFSFFFLKDGHEMKEAVVGAFSDTGTRAMVELIMEDMHNVLKNYIRALVILSVISFCVYSIALTLMGIPYELLIA